MSRQINKSSPGRMEPKSLLKAVAARFVLAVVLLGTLFFTTAWSFGYWQAWVYMLVLFVPMLMITRYMYRHDPALLERRLRSGEKQTAQKLVVALSSLSFLLIFAIPGFDVRFGWSNVPPFVVIISDLMVLFGYLMVALVFKTNSYASRIVEVEKGQKLVSTGPYAAIRHPMYLGVTVLFAFSPLALGSYWALIPVLPIIPLLVV